VGLLDSIESAFQKLADKSGFTARENQRQLALLLSDLIETGSRGLFEAPTGLGKSLAALIPAFAHAIHSGKRTVIATYTNGQVHRIGGGSPAGYFTSPT
jgi:ATP-dependent DNA helicase DinG